MAPEEAVPLLKELAQEDPDAAAPSGVPLLPLICWARLRMEAGVVSSRAEELFQAAVETHPSILTPELLEKAEAFTTLRGARVDTLPAWQARWKADEAARELLRELNFSEPLPRWIHRQGGSWWVERFGNALRTLPRARLELLASVVAGKISTLLPSYAGSSVMLAGEPLTMPLPPGSDLLAHFEREDFTINIRLVDAAQLYAVQRQQSFWLAALLICALAAELAAFWKIQQALKKEARLGELKSDFVSSVSHELRAPVASMRLMAENLDSGTVTKAEECRAYHRLMAEECRRLSVLIDNVLDFARIERNQRVYQFIETNVVALVHDAVQLMQARATRQRQRIRTELEPIEPICDGLAIRQALINLLDNAIKFSPEQTVITVRLTIRSATTWALSVTDEGPGIPKSERTRIFERFYRIGSELRRETQGTGIGLSIVQHIAEGHGGHVDLQSEPGAGATFSIVVPNSLSR
ncbi:MAG: HAMP domain-containing sensor histidine kinase [Verrucomicrobiota bacterium]